MQHQQQEADTNYTSLLSLLNYVGIRHEFLCELKERDWFTAWLHGDYVNHLKNLVKENMSGVHNSAQVEDILYGLGFTRERAKLIAKWIDDEPYSSHQTVLYFVFIYLENKLSQKVLPLRSKSMPAISPPASDMNNIVLYHSTTRNHAQNISHNGIRTNIGQPCQDFSDNGGFYLTDNLEYAIKWAVHRSFASDPAILVYTIPRKVISLFKGLHLYKECQSDMTLWKQIVQYNHTGREVPDPKMNYLYNQTLILDTENFQKHVDYILGPVSLYGGASMFSNVIQMCILTQHMADALSIDNNKFLYRIYEWGGSC